MTELGMYYLIAMFPITNNDSTNKASSVLTYTFAASSSSKSCRRAASVSKRYRAPAGTHLLRQTVAISGGMLHAGYPQTYCQTGSHRYFPAPGPERGTPGHIAQFFLKPLQHLARVTQMVWFKIAGHIRFHLPYLHRPCLSVSPSRRIVLRSLYYQFGKGMDKAPNQ